MDLVVDFAESSSTVEVPVAPRSSIEIHNSLNIVEFRECTNFEQMVRDRCPCLTLLLVYFSLSIYFYFRVAVTEQ